MTVVNDTNGEFLRPHVPRAAPQVARVYATLAQSSSDKKAKLQVALRAWLPCTGVLCLCSFRLLLFAIQRIVVEGSFLVTYFPSPSPQAFAKAVAALEKHPVAQVEYLVLLRHTPPSH